MDILHSLSGMLEVELTSADAARGMTEINSLGIPVFNVRTDGDLTICFQILHRDYKRILKYTERHGDRLEIIKKDGIYWKIRRVFQRPVFIWGIIGILLLTLYIPQKVFFIQVEGNKTIPSRQIVSAAQECGICFGANRREVRSEQMKNALLSSIPQLQWAGVNTRGCVAVITVKERAVTETEQEPVGVSNIVAIRDGVVLSCTVTQGTAVCSVGQAVHAGQVLVSGYTDCGLMIKATRADGEVYAKTRRNLTAVTPLEYTVRTGKQTEHTKYSLIIGKKQIKFGKDSRIYDASCAKIYKEYCITLPGAFRLPVSIVKETIFSSDTETQISDEEETDGLMDFASAYLKSQMIAGIITDQVQTAESVDGVSILRGEYACTELIGLEKAEGNGE